MGKYVEQNLNSNEKLIKKAELNPLAVIVKGLGGVIFIVASLVLMSLMEGVAKGSAIFLLIFGCFKLLTAFLRYLNTEFGLTNKRLVGKQGIINTESMDSPLDKVQNVSVSSGFWGKLFNYGNISVSTASGRFSFTMVKNVEAMKSAIMNQVEVVKEEQAKEQAKQFAMAMAATNAAAAKTE